MSARDDVIRYVDAEFGREPQLQAALRGVVAAMDADGVARQLRKAFVEHRPDLQFAQGGEVASGANYDSNSNTISVQRAAGMADFALLADNLLFEAFNCAHREEYRALSRQFNANTLPPMFFMDYGKQMSRIEGTVTYEYVSLLREVRGHGGPAMPDGAVRALKDNAEVGHATQMIARMSWTPHDPAGTGDWRFPTPAHYAFRKMMALTVAQTVFRVKALVVRAAGGAGLGAYGALDDNQRFQGWLRDRWTNLAAEHKPTTFITVCEEANRVFRRKVGAAWRPFALADYQMTTEMELEARRLLKRAVLPPAPDL